MISDSELIINPDGSIYHLKARPGDIASLIVTVGDPERVSLFEDRMDRIEKRIANREFRIVTGYISEMRFSVVSTGIGTDNIDIVLNEIDALFNIDFDRRSLKPEPTSLQIIRVGTSGAIRADIPLDTVIVSSMAAGLDGLLSYYQSEPYRVLGAEAQFKQAINAEGIYIVESDPELRTHFSALGTEGITVTAPGFYGPQSRSVRLPARYRLPQQLEPLSFQGKQYTNLEMETAGIYGLGKMLGHRCISLNAILANRITGEFSRQAEKTIDTLVSDTIKLMLEL